VSPVDTLMVFARYPVPGAVKTRLATGIGEDGAARLYEAFVRDLAARFTPARFAVRWAVAPPDPGFAARFGLAPDRCREQCGGDLGARMRDAFEHVLAAEGSRCVLIGSDAPHLPVSRIEEAFSRLDSADVVLGPARDGGYYLIAMRRPHDLFSGITWSVDSVHRETVAQARSLGLTVASLPVDFDVDEVGDLARLRRRIDEGDVRCPETARVLRELAHP